MKNKIFQIIFVAIIAPSIISSLFVGNVSQARAQSSHVWSDPVNLSNSGGASDPILVVDTLGVIHAIWTDQYEGFKYSQSKDGVEWTTPITAKYPFVSKILHPQAVAPLPTLVSGSDGFIYIFWQDDSGTLVFAQAHSENLDDPSAWAYRKVMSDNILAFHVAVDLQGGIHVAYIRKINDARGPAGVYYMRSQDQGRSWSTEKLLYSSQYYRITGPESAHIRVVPSSEAGDSKVFVAWDNTAIKQAFITSSNDSGSNWAEAVQLKDAAATGGYNTPYNVNMSFMGQTVLLSWEVGEPGSDQCILYGQWSKDGGSNWGDPNIILEYRSICPSSIDFRYDKANSIIALLKYQQENPSLMVWNGTQWSAPQAQSELSYFANPVTHESILLGCQNFFMSTSSLFLIGCDQGSSGDIWITSRALDPSEDFTFSTSLWSLPTLFTEAPQPIQSAVYTTDGDKLNILWSEAPIVGASNLSGSINFAKWDGAQWSQAQGVINGLSERIEGLSSVLNKKQGRLLLVWSNEDSGSLFFSWADASRLTSVSEWDDPHELPSPSQRTSSPDILVDASGRIVVVYAVPFNENRGIYIVQSADNGVTWTEPIKAFDAVSAGWDMVNYPKITISGDGGLHLLFTKASGLDNTPEGLYYSQSKDGGMTWSTPEVVSDGSVVWSDIVCYDGQTIHRLWQVDDKSVVANLHQVSQDGGINWGKVNEITGASNVITPVTLAVNDTGNLHFMQLTTEDSPHYVKEYDMQIKDWMWDGTEWKGQPSQAIKIRGDQLRYSLAAGISSTGFISASVVATYYDLNGKPKNEIYNVDRILNTFTQAKTSFVPIIPTTANVSATTQVANVQSTQQTPAEEPTLNPLLVEKAPSIINRNLVGVFLILIVLGLVLFIFLRRPRSRSRKHME